MEKDHLVGRIGADGMVTVATSGVEPPPPSSDECGVLARGWFLSRTYKCGHRDKRSFKLRCYGMTSSWIRQKERCPECELNYLKEVVIRCCYCGHPIFPGHGVCLYAIDSPGIETRWGKLISVPEIGGGEVKAYIGCMLMGCGSGGGFSGHWSESGFQAYDSSRHFV